MTEYAVNDRVVHEFLGAGTIVEVEDFGTPLSGWLIKFDDTPPTEYNLGCNPVFEFRQNTLRKEL